MSTKEKRSNSKYASHVQPYLDKIEGWLRKGATEKEVAANLHISWSTLKLYLKRGRDGEDPYSALSDLFVRACEEPDDKVEASLFKLATGYHETVQKKFKVKRAVFDPHTGRKIEEYEELVDGEEQVYVPANVNAQTFWLANRRRDKWALKPESEQKDEDASEDRGVIMIPEIVPLEAEKK